MGVDSMARGLGFEPPAVTVERLPVNEPGQSVRDSLSHRGPSRQRTLGRDRARSTYAAPWASNHRTRSSGPVAS